MPAEIITQIRVYPSKTSNGLPLFSCLFNVGVRTNKVPFAWIDNLGTAQEIRFTVIPVPEKYCRDNETVKACMEEYCGQQGRQAFIDYLVQQMRQRQVEESLRLLQASRRYVGSAKYFMDMAALARPKFDPNLAIQRQISHHVDKQEPEELEGMDMDELKAKVLPKKMVMIGDLPQALTLESWKSYAFDSYEMNMIWGIMTSYPMVSYEQMSGTGSCPMEFRRVAKPIDKVITTNSRIVFEKFLNKIRRWHCLTSPEGSSTRGATSLVPLPQVWDRIKVAEDYLKLSEAERKQLVGDTLTAMSYCSVIDIPGQSSVWSVYKAAKSYQWDTVTGQYTAQRLFRDLRHMNEWRVMTYGEPIRKEQLAKAEELRQHDERVERRKAKARQQVSAQEPAFVESVPVSTGGIPVVPFQERESLVGCGEHLPKDQRILLYTKLIPDVALPIEDQAEQWDEIWANQLVNGIPFQGELAPKTPEQTELLSQRIIDKYQLADKL